MVYSGCSRLRLRAVRYVRTMASCVWGLGEGCAVNTVMGMSNRCEIPCAAQSRRSTVNWLMARRSAVGAASQNRRESNRGETGNGDPLWHLNSRWPATVNWPAYHGGLGPIRGTFKSRYVPGWEARNSARYWTGTPTLAGARFREPKRLRSCGNYLSIQSQKTMWPT